MCSMIAFDAWQPMLPPDLNPILADWLLTPDSLTNRLLATHYPFSVRLIGLNHRPPTHDEAALLGSGVEQVLCRQVCLRLDGETVVYAASVCDSSDREWCKTLDRGGRSLGFTLFAEQAPFNRSPLSFRRLHLGDPLFHAALPFLVSLNETPCLLSLPRPDHLWARRAAFTARHGGQLLVQEVFLPTLLNKTTPQVVSLSNSTGSR